jgi:hypothetical protein
MNRKRRGREMAIHVGALANGKADGSAAHPYPTLDAARKAVRRLRRGDGCQVPVRVLIAPGVYRLEKPLVFTPEDGGTAECPVTWSGDGGRPLLSGARVIAGWRSGTINSRPCWQVDLQEVKAGRWWFTQLFVNGRRRLRARLPKQGLYRFAGVPEEEAKVDAGGHFHGAMSALFEPGEIRAFRNLADIEVVVPDHWYENHLRIESVDEANRLIRFATKGWSRFSRDETGRHTRFRLDHVAEACTEPGDWYLDRPTGTLSYIPLPGEKLETTFFEAPALDLLLSVQGDALNPERRVRHLRFEFLDLRHADWELPRNNPGALQSAMNVPAAVRLVGAEDCALYGCRVSQAGGWAIEVLRGCHRNRIVACALHDLGGGGVKIGHEGGLPREWVEGSQTAFRGLDAAALGWGPCREEPGGLMPGRDRSEPSATTVSDCSIHDGGIIFHSAIGVWIGDAGRNRVVHNHIWNFNYSGISCGWTWGYAPAFACDNRIEGNHIHGIGHDMGAIYTLGRQAGTTIRRNYIHDVDSYGYGGWGIYTDEGSSWIRVEENVVCRTRSGGFMQHYGRDNIVRHNLFAEAVGTQVQISRREMMGSLTFRGNLVQGAGNGELWAGEGWATAGMDGNVYVGAPGRTAEFAGQTWEQWRAGGRDRAGKFLDAVLLDAGGDLPLLGCPEAFKAAGLDPRRLSAVVAEAGPRLGLCLPPSIDDVRQEPEKRRPLVEACLWPWPAEWPGDHPWGSLPSCAITPKGAARTFSLTLENRGDAPVRGEYRLKVVPASAARFEGPRRLAVNLKPGARTQLEVTLVATGQSKAFCFAAEARGVHLPDSRLFCVVARDVPPTLTIQCLSVAPKSAGLLKTLEPLTPHPLDGNGCPVTASVRLAVAGDRLLFRLDTEDAAPVRRSLLWEGSSVELFVAPKVGAPRRQLIAAPPVGEEAVGIKLDTPAGMIIPEGVEAVGTMTKTGWALALSIPLAVLGLEGAADGFALDLAVNAASADGIWSRTQLAGVSAPYPSSAGYARVVVGCK